MSTEDKTASSYIDIQTYFIFLEEGEGGGEQEKATAMMSTHDKWSDLIHFDF